MTRGYSDMQKTVIQVVGASGPIDIDLLVDVMADVIRQRAPGPRERGHHPVRSRDPRAQRRGETRFTAPSSRGSYD